MIEQSSECQELFTRAEQAKSLLMHECPGDRAQ